MLFFDSKTPEIGYNLTDGGEGAPGYKMSATAIAKMRAAKTGKKYGPEARANMAASHIGNKSRRGQKRTDKELSKQSETMKGIYAAARVGGPPVGMLGRKHTASWKARLSARMKGNQYRVGSKTSEETKQKMSMASLGKPKSEEHRKNISKGKKGIYNVS